MFFDIEIGYKFNVKSLKKVTGLQPRKFLVPKLHLIVFKEIPASFCKFCDIEVI